LILAVGLRLVALPPGWLPKLLAAAALIGVVCAFRGTPLDLLSGSDLAILAVAALVALISVPRIAVSNGDGAAPVLVFVAVSVELAWLALIDGGRLDGNFALALGAASLGWLAQLLLMRSRLHVGPELPALALLLATVAVDFARTALHTPWPLLALV